MCDLIIASHLTCISYFQEREKMKKVAELAEKKPAQVLAESSSTSSRSSSDSSSSDEDEKG